MKNWGVTVVSQQNGKILVGGWHSELGVGVEPLQPPVIPTVGWSRAEPKASQWEQDIHNRLQFAMRFGDEHDLLKPHQAVIFVCGSRPGPGTTNSIRILPYIKK